MKLSSIFGIKAAQVNDKPAERMALDEPYIEPTANDRLLDIMERERLPSDVNQVMANAINGDLR